ncbi:MAG: hypothetical protein IKO38_04475, partial [Erysipelotrichaceae bacterium]|nr:hypothetical protein [Erysipelotrichaceae bacterium]
MFNVIHISPVSVSFESDEDRPYYSSAPYEVYVNGAFCRKEDRNVFTIFGLSPDTSYEVKIGNDVLT